jgi:hypothetical protein
MGTTLEFELEARSPQDFEYVKGMMTQIKKDLKQFFGIEHDDNKLLHHLVAHGSDKVAPTRAIRALLFGTGATVQAEYEAHGGGALVRGAQLMMAVANASGRLSNEKRDKMNANLKRILLSEGNDLTAVAEEAKGESFEVRAAEVQIAANSKSWYIVRGTEIIVDSFRLIEHLRMRVSKDEMARWMRANTDNWGDALAVRKLHPDLRQSDSNLRQQMNTYHGITLFVLQRATLQTGPHFDFSKSETIRKLLLHRHKLVQVFNLDPSLPPLPPSFPPSILLYFFRDRTAVVEGSLREFRSL